MKKNKTINVAYYSEWDDIRPWKEKLKLKNINLLQWPNEVIKPDEIELALVWDAPKNFWKDLKNLKLVHSLGAGVDHINYDILDKNIKISRLVDPDLSAQMAEYAIMSVLICQRNLFNYFKQNKLKIWKQLGSPSKKDFPITILGYGKIGHFINKQLNALGFNTRVWTRTKHKRNNKNFYFGSKQLLKCIKGTKCLISLLPLTKETRNLIALNEFKALGNDSYFVNIGRGKTIKEKDLIYALKNKIIKGAIVDVFEKEPLKQKHPYWNMENIIITPHIAAATRVTDYAVEDFAKNISLLYQGKKLNNLISRQKGY